VLAALDLDPDALTKPVRALSKGMAQKLGLAAVLLSGKALYVLDEPMSGLDPRARALLKQHLLAQRHSGVQTLFFSTHLLPDVETLCDRMIILHAGIPRFIGTPAECCAAYDAPDLETAYLRCVAD
jgi:ABC-2 type transport system ATP-binding protein